MAKTVKPKLALNHVRSYVTTVTTDDTHKCCVQDCIHICDCYRARSTLTAQERRRDSREGFADTITAWMPAAKRNTKNSKPSTYLRETELQLSKRNDGNRSVNHGLAYAFCLRSVLYPRARLTLLFSMRVRK